MKPTDRIGATILGVIYKALGGDRAESKGENSKLNAKRVETELTHYLKATGEAIVYKDGKAQFVKVKEYNGGIDPIELGINEVRANPIKNTQFMLLDNEIIKIQK